eukprot:m.589449 g.589449  ORF g.589449 m.589449 type:complete len:1124 (-) comp22371_c0_seq6:281-3652(-)
MANFESHGSGIGDGGPESESANQYSPTKTSSLSDQDIRDALNWDENSQSLHCPGLEVDTLPSLLAEEYPSAKSLDVSYGALSNFESLVKFSTLESLVCDQNQLLNIESFPVLEHLDTLSVNKNNIASLTDFLGHAQNKFPKLSYLSMIGNPCCPSELTGGTESEYATYRAQVLAKLPILKFLDSEKVDPASRPRTVESISAQKLVKGDISNEEYEHILKVHAMLAQLDAESADLLASSDDDDESDVSMSETSSPRATQDSSSDVVEPQEKMMGDSLDVFDKIVSEAAKKTPELCESPSAEKDSGSGIRPRGAGASLPPRVTGITGSADPTRTPAWARPLADTDNDPEYDFATSEAYKAMHTETSTVLPNIDLNETAERSLEITSKLQASRTIVLDKGPTGYDMHVAVDGTYIRICMVTPNGVAAQAGVVVGDVLLACNGVGLVGASVADAEQTMLSEHAGNQIELEVAGLTLELPDATIAGTQGANPTTSDAVQRRSPEKRRFAVGAMTKSVAIRPLYCEVLVHHRRGSPAGTMGFTVNTLGGDDPLVDTVDDDVSQVKTGDVIKSVDGNLATPHNIHKLLRESDDPATLDIIRYRVEEREKTQPPPASHAGSLTVQQHDLPTGWEARVGDDGVPQYCNPDTGEMQLQRPITTPPAAAIEFDAQFAGAATVEQLKATEQKNNSKFIKNATKQAQREAKLAKKEANSDFSGLPGFDVEEAKKPGKVCVSITAHSIVATREHKKKGRRSTSSEPLSPEGASSPSKSSLIEVFTIGTADIFSAVARKRKMLLMVQPDPPASAVCYVLKFSREKACKHAAAACSRLSGHVEYERTGKKKAAAKPTKRGRRSKRAAAADDATSHGKRDSTVSTASAASVAATSDGAAVSGSATSAEPSTPTSPSKPRRGKLVRGGNAIHTPTLPEFTEALDAITSLDTFLDETAVSEGDAEGTHNEPEEDDANSAHDGGSETPGCVARDADDNASDGRDTDKDDNDANDNDNDADDNHNDADDNDDSGDEDDNAGDEDDDESADFEFFKILANKRAARENEQKARQAQLAAEADRLRDELNVARALEMEKINREREEARLREDRYKEYCAVGAAERLKELTFKFKWGQGPNLMEMANV